MTAKEKNLHVEQMNDALCEICSSYQDCACDGCAFARPIDIAGLKGTIISAIDYDDYLDATVFVKGFLANVMIMNGKPIAISDENGLVRLGDAPIEYVEKFVENYAPFERIDWEDSMPCVWNPMTEDWEEVCNVS